MTEARRKDERHNAFVVKKWIEYRERIFGLGGERLTDLPPMDRKSKGESRPALTESAMKFINDPDNDLCLRIIEPLIENARDQGRKFSPKTASMINRSVDIYALFCKCGYATEDHAFLRELQEPQTEDQRLLKAAWDFSCMALGISATRRLAADGIVDDNGRHRLHIQLNPEEFTADNPVQARNRDNNQKKKLDAEDRYRELNARIQKIMDFNECTFREAVEIYRQRLETRKQPDVSPATIYRARAFCQGKPEGKGAATWEYERWMRENVG